jgi:hypothetical protein
MSGRRPGRSLPCPRPQSRREDVRPTGRADVQRPGVQRPGVQRPGVRCPGVRCIQVSGRTGLRCPRRRRRAVRAALDPGVARVAGRLRIGRSGSTCPRGLWAPWSPACTRPDGKGWCRVGRAWLAQGLIGAQGRRLAGVPAAAPPGRRADTGAGPGPGCRPGGGGAWDRAGAHRPRRASWAGRRRGVRPWAWTKRW